MAYTPQTWVDGDGANHPLSAARMNYIETGIQQAAALNPTSQQLDSFAGATDDAKLTAAMQYAGAQSYPPFITLGNRVYNFATPRTPYDGFRLRGPGSPSNAEKQSGAGKYNTALVQLADGITWMTFPNNGGATGNDVNKAFDMYFGGFAIRGGSTTQVFATAAGVTLWCSQFDNLSIANVKSCFGSLTTNFRVTNLHFTGIWDVGNCYSTAFVLGGSDCTLWMEGGALIDSGPGFSPAPGTFHVWLNFLNNSDIGAVYLTCQGPWAGMRIDGPAFNATNQAGHLNFWGTRIEGQNANVPCDGALIRGNGGLCNFYGAHLAHGMNNPGSYTAAGHSPVDAGIVHLTAGQYHFSGPEYDRTTGQTDQNPLLFYNNGARLRVSDVMLNATGGTWSSAPAAHTVSGTTFIDYGSSSPTVAAV